MGKPIRAEQNFTKQPFLLSVDEIVQHLQTTQDHGLSNSQAQQYQEKYGPNRLEGDGGVSWYAILGKQISNAMILVCPPFVLCNRRV
jgi:magnesium-transporting ATPase (P-type)